MRIQIWIYLSIMVDSISTELARKMIGNHIEQCTSKLCGCQLNLWCVRFLLLFFSSSSSSGCGWIWKFIDWPYKIFAFNMNVCVTALIYIIHVTFIWNPWKHLEQTCGICLWLRLWVFMCFHITHSHTLYVNAEWRR